MSFVIHQQQHTNPVTSFRELTQGLIDASKISLNVIPWIQVLKIIEKLPNWKLRSKATDKIIPILQSLRDTKLDLQSWHVAYKLFHQIGDWFTLGHSQTPLYPYNPTIVQKLVEHFNNPSSKSLPVVMTMTSCKRIDLLTRTIDSMIVNCLDITQHVSQWILIDDNSSEEDRNRITALYPFLTVVLKGPEDKGHPRSMNMLYDIFCSSNATFNWHIEDDWEWWFPDYYITKCMKVLEENKHFGQALVNFEYTEDQYSAQRVWNREMKYVTIDLNDKPYDLRYFVHEYYVGERLNIEQNALGAPSSMYWPHFSFRVGLTRIEVYRQLGKFNEQAKHFEMDYAHRYVQEGYKTAMLDCCYTTHIGRRTYERETSKLNAYDLNEEQQFGSAPKTKAEGETPTKEQNKPEEKQEEGTKSHMKVSRPLFRPQDLVESVNETHYLKLKDYEVQRIVTYVINLEKRPERLVQFMKRNNLNLPSFEVFNGVDGAILQPNIKTQRIFETGDYNFRGGIVGCAYSHLKLWQKFIKSSNQFALVFEDDVTLSFGFQSKLVHLLNTYQNKFDLMFLHWNPQHHLKDKMDQEWNMSFVKPTAELWSVEKSIRDNMGSGAAYIMTRKAARHMLDWVNKHGMPNAVDWNLYKQQGLRIMYSKPMLAFAICWHSNTAIQSDIQMDYHSVGYSSINDMLNDEINRWLTLHNSKGVFYTINEADQQSLEPQGALLYQETKKVFEHNPKSIVAFSYNYYPTFEWKVLLQRIVIVPKQTGIPKFLPCKWYLVGPFKIVVPDLLLTLNSYKAVPWFNNRINFMDV